MARRDDEGEINSLCAMAEYCAYQGYGDLVLPILNKFSQLHYRIAPGSRPHVQYLFFTLNTTIAKITYTDASSFENLLKAFDALDMFVQKDGPFTEYEWVEHRLDIIQQMCITILRRLVFNEKDSRVPRCDEEIKPTASFQFGEYCRAVADLFKKHARPAESVGAEDLALARITVLNAIVVKHKSSSTTTSDLLDKSAAYKLIAASRLTSFRTKFVGFSRDLQKDVSNGEPLLTISWSGADGAFPRAADWNQEQRDREGPYAGVVAGPRSGDHRPSNGGVALSPGGDGFDMEDEGGVAQSTASAVPPTSRQAKRTTPQKPNSSAGAGAGAGEAPAPVATQGKAALVVSASSTARGVAGTGVQASTYKKGDLKRAMSNFNKKVTANDPLNGILMAPVDSKIASMTMTRAKKSSSSSSSSAAAVTAATNGGKSQSQQSSIAEDMNGEVLTQAQFCEDDEAAEEVEEAADAQPKVTKVSNGKRTRSAAKADGPYAGYTHDDYFGDEDDADEADEDFRAVSKTSADRRPRASPRTRSAGRVDWGNDSDNLERDDDDKEEEDDHLTKRTRGAVGAGYARQVLLNAKTVAARMVPAAPGRKTKASSAGAGAGAGAAYSSKGAKAKKCIERLGKVKWSLDEIEVLLEAIRVHGVGNWATMMKDDRFGPALASRDAIALKDKYRNMKNAGEI